MRVLHLMKTSVGGTWAFRQMRELVRLGIDVHVALPEGGQLFHQYAAAGVTTHAIQPDFPIRRPWRLPQIVRRLRQVIADVKPDLIHSHFVGTTLTMRLALGRTHAIPRLFQVPGPLHLEHSLFRWGELATAGRADYWIGSCHWTCDRYRQAGIAADRIFLSYYGTDLDLLRPGSAGKLRSVLGISATAKVVGMVAYMYAPKRYLGQTRGLKGHEDLIDAIAICQRQVADLVCVVVGGAWDGADWYEQQVRAYARRQCGDSVIFLGYRPDVPELYPDMDLAVHPSHSENIGGAVESLAMGIPTIATSVGGFPDVVIDGETGWLVPPHSPESLAEAILAALRNQDKARQMALCGQKLVTELFDVRTTAQEIASVYESILA